MKCGRSSETDGCKHDSSRRQMQLDMETHPGSLSVQQLLQGFRMKQSRILPDPPRSSQIRLSWLLSKPVHVPFSSHLPHTKSAVRQDGWSGWSMFNWLVFSSSLWGDEGAAKSGPGNGSGSVWFHGHPLLREVCQLCWSVCSLARLFCLMQDTEHPQTALNFSFFHSPWENRSKQILWITDCAFRVTTWAKVPVL